MRAAGEPPGGGGDPLADERVRLVEPGDADPELLERLEGGRLEAGGERAQQLGATVDRRRHRADVVVARREREDAAGGHEVVRRLEARDPAPGRRDADRAAGVGAERQLDVAGGDRRGRAAARPAGEPAWIAWVRHGAEVRVLRGDAVRELVQVRLAGDSVAGSLDAQDCVGAARRHVVCEEDRAVRRDEPRGVEQVLDRDGRARRRLLRPCKPHRHDGETTCGGRSASSSA